jgi:hypothetical protein
MNYIERQEQRANEIEQSFEQEMKEQLELLSWLSDILQTALSEGWSFKDVISEICTAGFNNEEIAFLCKSASLNSTFTLN